MTTIDIDDLAQIIRQVDGNHDMGAGALAEAILDRLPAPQIIRTVEELEALNPDTVLIDRDGEESFAFRMQASIRNLGTESMYHDSFPAVVIRDGAQVRAARKALEKA